MLLLLRVLPLWSQAAAEAEEALPYQEGYASWYGWQFHGRRTASGEVFDMNELTAAHRELPFGTLLRVTNTRNGSSVVVKINDRGPFVEGRILDLSKAAADVIGMGGSGVVWVALEIVQEVPDPRYAIQVGAYNETKNALRAAERVEEQGLQATVRKVEGGIIRVLVDDIGAEELEHVKERLRAAGFSSFLVKTLPAEVPTPKPMTVSEPPIKPVSEADGRSFPLLEPDVPGPAPTPTCAGDIENAPDLQDAPDAECAANPE
jgi:rare lipoprotein A